MISRSTLVLLKVVGVCAGAGVGFVLCQESMRAAEASMTIATLSAFGADGVHAVGRTTLLVIPHQQAAFHVLITPSCSSIASVVAFACLAPVIRMRSVARRAAGFGVATILIVTGNVVRIAGSVAVGLVAGRGSLVLFHDWVGSMFTVVYTLTGYMIMLAFLLPANDRPVLLADRVAVDAV